jgi:hypothetical protein
MNAKCEVRTVDNGQVENIEPNNVAFEIEIWGTDNWDPLQLRKDTGCTGKTPYSREVAVGPQGILVTRVRRGPHTASQILTHIALSCTAPWS